MNTFIEAFIAILIIFPAVLLAAQKSAALLDYTFYVYAFNRGLRRLVDYYVHHEFQPFSMISLTPLIVAGILILPVIGRLGTLNQASRFIFTLLATAVGYGFIVGFVQNGIGAIYSLGEWMSALGAFAFAATIHATPQTANRWIKTAAWTAVGVAAYGWYQYLTIPPWDAFWVRAVKFEGYLGILEPTKMAVFSTLHERGPCAGYLAWAAIPMILQKRWRIVGGWIFVLFFISAILLTLTRTTLIIIAVVALLQPLLARGRGAGQVVLAAGFFVIFAQFVVQKLPGAASISKRYNTLRNIGDDGSFRGRLDIYSYGIANVLSNPVGTGLGSGGMAARVQKKEGNISDSGYVQIFYEFGWLGGFLFYAALGLMYVELSSRVRRGSLDVYVLSSRAVLLGCLVFLFVGNIFSGFAVYWVIFGRALSQAADPGGSARKLPRKYTLPPAEPLPDYETPPETEMVVRPVH